MKHLAALDKITNPARADMINRIPLDRRLHIIQSKSNVEKSDPNNGERAIMPVKV